MHLARFPRRQYTAHPTPIEKLERLSAFLGGPDIYVKRDDLTGLTGGGNKTRKLEFLVADALARGADTLITVGAVQSNHCRLTLAAAVKEGLQCRLVLEQRVPGSYHEDASGNNLLFRLLGAESITVVEGGADLAGVMQGIADDLTREGRQGYVIPGAAPTPSERWGMSPALRNFWGRPTRWVWTSIMWSAPAAAQARMLACWSV
ncbi:pyridoxal-phosphate dependent enzyme [Deinococcus malanensis]|uniref:pyridoxal-phosphate dependent enzyme n=1 Tax=Deinococcus malanensis TaxID=1706855 RepID=UPI003634CCEA